MAVFRVQKTQNYTIMSNHHLRNKALSLKAKGLLSLMLSLPEDWDYTTRGLASICKEGVDSVCATVRELEAAGYIIRRRIRDKNGQMRGMEYTVLEQPQPLKQGPEEAVPMQCGCCGARLYWHSKSNQWFCRECGMWSKPTQAKETFNSIVEKLRWLQQNSELVHPPAGKANPFRW